MTVESTSVLSDDETLVCCSCHRQFKFTGSERHDHDRRGYKKPKRCKPCREARRSGSEPIGMSNDDMLIEMCKALGELRIFLEQKLRSIEDRLDAIEELANG